MTRAKRSSVLRSFSEDCGFEYTRRVSQPSIDGSAEIQEHLRPLRLLTVSAAQPLFPAIPAGERPGTAFLSFALGNAHDAPSERHGDGSAQRRTA